ncbi:bifunctional diguanylate cyclase/phosphodiesterase [bacterium]|nr:bifunctional diguanylate cyclase/phosphodiesterase [bacterium]
MPAEAPLRRLLLLHRDPALARRVRTLLEPADQTRHRVAHFTHLADALTCLQIDDVDLVLVGPEPADVDQVRAVQRLGAARPETPQLALMVSPDAAHTAAVRAAGARESLPLDEADLPAWLRTIDFCLREAAIARELAEVTARLDWLVHMDGLTGLLNRKGMERVLRAELAGARGTGRELTVLLVDLDDFSRLNATLGHGVGDLVLVGAARRIRESVREQDKVGRCGTDRFVVLLPDAAPGEAEVVAEKIRLAIGRDVITAGGQSLQTTASLSLTTVADADLSWDEVMARAHFVLQQGKLGGKNRVSHAASVEPGGPVLPALAGPHMVRALLEDDVLEAASQPIVNLDDGRIVSREMLVRGPEGPLRRPDNLFRFCQENDILAAVDLRCLRLCAAHGRRLGPRPDYHVNIMPATLLQTPAPELVRALTDGRDDVTCCLEISEQQLLGDPSVLVPHVRALQQAGVRIAIDDVGFGNSCLEGLIMLHPQVVKVDKRLVRGLAVDPEMRRALSRLLRVADVLEAEVVAEGIETTDDFRVLADMGVRFGQGYLFGRPVPCGQTAPGAPDAAAAEA